jgi:hypothetical protein
MLQLFRVPGRKLLLELERHLDEELSIAIALESESNGVDLSMGAAIMQVISTA